MDDGAGVSGWIAAIAAVGAALVVAWQSWETRKSAAASRDAANTANAALELTRQMAAEAVRARLDADMPKIAVLTTLHATSLMQFSQLGGPARDVSIGDSFFTPRDAGKYLAVTATAEIHNRSDEPVKIDVAYLAIDSGRLTAKTLHLLPGEKESIHFMTCRTVADWIAGNHWLQDGGSSLVTIFFATFANPNDNGAADHWHVSASGSLLEPDPEVSGGYRVAHGSATRHELYKRRSYYLSREHDKELE